MKKRWAANVVAFLIGAVIAVPLLFVLTGVAVLIGPVMAKFITWCMAFWVGVFNA